MRRADAWITRLCPGCGSLLEEDGQHVGHRTKRFHNAACKQRYYRSQRYKTVQVFERTTQKNTAKLAELDASIAETEVQLLKREIVRLKEKNAELEGDVARLTTLLGITIEEL